MTDASPTTHAHAPIVVAVDGSNESEKALQWALDQARSRRIDLRVLTCYQHTYTRGRSASVSWEGFHSNKGEVTERARRTIAAVAGKHNVEHVITRGPVESALQKHGNSASMIVLGTRNAIGQGEDYRSITDHITGRVRCPVVSIPLENHWLERSHEQHHNTTNPKAATENIYFKSAIDCP